MNYVYFLWIIFHFMSPIYIEFDSFFQAGCFRLDHFLVIQNDLIWSDPDHDPTWSDLILIQGGGSDQIRSFLMIQPPGSGSDQIISEKGGSSQTLVVLPAVYTSPLTHEDRPRSSQLRPALFAFGHGGTLVQWLLGGATIRAGSKWILVTQPMVATIGYLTIG